MSQAVSETIVTLVGGFPDAPEVTFPLDWRTQKEEKSNAK